MKNTTSLPSRWLFAAMALATLSCATTTRANVYATDIKINGGFSNLTSQAISPVTVTYILNEPATAGVTISILSGTNLVDTISLASPAPGTAFGSNSVVWGGTNSAGNLVGPGTYVVAITAAANGFTNWTQTSPDSSNNIAASPEGIAVDNNTNSQYYGRVMLGCSQDALAHGVIQHCGIYKLNADGSPADEGSFGYGGYTTNDAGTSVTGEMSSGGGNNPWRLRIGDDDRLYMDDYSDLGAIIAFDMKVTTNQIVINAGSGSALGGPNNYGNNPDVGDLSAGINDFDVTGAGTANAAVWLCDSDSPGWGIWMYHLKNGAADPADTMGTQVVTPGNSSDLKYGSEGGCTIDTNLDVFTAQVTSDLTVPAAMEFTNWNHGILPPEAGLSKYTLGTNLGEFKWSLANGNAADGIQDTVINSRKNPTLVALPLNLSLSTDQGITLLNATNGMAVMTNLDIRNQYNCAAWDNVGNLYAASPSTNYWRVWSPPGTNQATTTALAQLIVLAPIQITGITNSAVTPGAITITFTGPNAAASAYSVVQSTTVNGPYSAFVGAAITGSAGTYQAALTNAATAFYQIVGP